MSAVTCPNCGAPEGAEPLKWDMCGRGLRAASMFGKSYLVYEDKNGADIMDPESKSWIRFPTIELAKAHAEELHQAAWRELIKKWGRK